MSYTPLARKDKKPLLSESQYAALPVCSFFVVPFSFHEAFLMENSIKPASYIGYQANNEQHNHIFNRDEKLVRTPRIGRCSANPTTGVHRIEILGRIQKSSNPQERGLPSANEEEDPV